MFQHHSEDSVQKARLKQRNPELTDEQVRQRINAQRPLTEKVAMANHVIDNNGNLTATYAQVKQVLKREQPPLLATLFWWSLPWISATAVLMFMQKQ
jgi:dephospho-CoA kinase